MSLWYQEALPPPAEGAIQRSLATRQPLRLRELPVCLGVWGIRQVPLLDSYALKLRLNGDSRGISGAGAVRTQLDSDAFEACCLKSRFASSSLRVCTRPVGSMLVVTGGDDIVGCTKRVKILLDRGRGPPLFLAR